MFRYRSYGILFLATMLPVFCATPPSSHVSYDTQMAQLRDTTIRTKPGIDVLEAQGFAPLRGKHVGLITNQTGVDSRGQRTVDVLAHAPGTQLIALFSPEHGFAGTADTKVADTTDTATGLPIYSLYGATRRPTDAMLLNIDALVFDIQDVGVRFYTYITTMAYCMEASAAHHIPFFVLDRPDPLGGVVMEGPLLDRGQTSFTGYFPIPVRYAMTIGELAQMFNSEEGKSTDLRVIAMRDWRRNMSYDQTGLPWIVPSPNLRTVDEVFLYPGLEILQAGGVSVGRGTSTPFEFSGAPWIRAEEFAASLNLRRISGVSFVSARVTPGEEPFKGQVCQGVKIAVTDRTALCSMRMGLEIADALHRMYPTQFQLQSMITLLGSQSTIDALARGESPEDIVAGWSGDLEKFRQMREKYLLYH
jgi:uncharacterized protein YbbC (DUF1343 family)